jgi:DNA-binding MarR family transcriptional regulator
VDADSVIRLRRVVLGLARQLNAASVGEGLTPAQASVLAVIVNRGPLRLAELAEIEGINPTMLSRLIRTLSASGLIRRRRDPTDFRAAQVEVTEQGDAAWQRISAERAKVISEYVTYLPVEQEAALSAALPALENLAERLRASAQALLRAGRSRPSRHPSPGGTSTDTLVALTAAMASMPGSRPSSSTASRLTSDTNRCGPAWISTWAMTVSRTIRVTSPGNLFRSECALPVCGS